MRDYRGARADVTTVVGLDPSTPAIHGPAIADPLAAPSEMRRVLKPGGVLPSPIGRGAGGEGTTRLS